MLKEVKLVRIDERLIHAQIILIWIKQMNINSIIVVDDEIAKNTFLTQIFVLTTPSNIDMKILTEEEMETYYQKNKDVNYTTRRTLILIKNLSTLVTLYNRGIMFDSVQVNENGKKYSSISKYVKEEKENLNFLEEKKVTVYCQKVPTDPKVTLTQV